MKLGLYARLENLPAGERQDLRTVYSDLLERCMPVGPLEELAIERIATNTCRLRQLLVVEAGVNARYEEVATVSPPATLPHSPPPSGTSAYKALADAVIRDAAGANVLEKLARRRVGVERALDRDQPLLLELQRARNDAAGGLIDTEHVGEAVTDERTVPADAAQPTDGDDQTADPGVGDTAPDAGTDGENDIQDGDFSDNDVGIAGPAGAPNSGTSRSG